jgi:PKD repeat protein
MNPQIIHWHFKTKLARAFVTGALAIFLGLTGLAAHAQTVIWSDNFNCADTGNFDTSSQTGRHTGLLANSVVGQSGGIELTISGDELNIFKTGSGNDGRMRFAVSANLSGRWDWASGIGGSTITSGGGMKIDFDWTAANNTSGDWVSYSVGITPNSDVNLRILDGGTASGIILKNNGTAQVFQNGAGGATGNFNVSSLTRHVTLVYSFTSFADGSPVTLTAYVGGTQVMTQSFTWNADSGVQNMEISSYANGSQIDNFTVSSVNTVVPPSLYLATDTTAIPSTNNGVSTNVQSYVGRNLTFSASFGGAQPMTNQWEVNTGSGFVPLTGATNATLTLTNLQLANSGASYALFASNSAGASNSTPVTLTVLAAPTAISWHYNDYSTVTGPSEYAGVVSVANWVDSWANGNPTANLWDNLGNATTLGISYTSDNGGWMLQPWNHPGQDANGTYNKELLNGYLNGGSSSVAISGIPYSSYNIIVYFSSDTAGRGGWVNVGSTIYYFTTMGSAANTGPNGVFTQATDTTGNSPTANADYAIFTGLSGTSQTIASLVNGGGGIAGFQVVYTGPLFLEADTTASPSTNAYVGGAVTLSASFGDAQSFTNQWEVSTGGGAFVPITGATNTTLTLSNLQLTNSGNYALFASDSAGASSSTPVTLTVLATPTSIAFNVQFTGGGFGSGNCPVQTGAAMIGGVADVWNAFSNPNGDANPPAGRAKGTNLTLVDVGSIATTLTMDYVGDYFFNGTAWGSSNPFVDAGSPVANLMSGYMGSVTQSGNSAGDTNTITLHNLLPGIYDLYLYGCGRDDGQTRVNVFTANGQSAVCGPNSGSSTLTAGVNYVHLTPTVAANGLLNISYIGTADNGQALLDGFQVSGPSTSYTIFQATDTSSDSPATDYVGRFVTFSAAFGGNPAPTLQWEVDKGDGNGYVNVPNATNSTLTLTNVQTTDSGNYSLYAGNVAGNLNSTPLTLTVETLPSVLAVNVQFVGSARGSSLAATQVGGAVIGNGSGSDYWNPVSNPNPTGNDPATNTITGSILGLTDAGSVGTSLSLAYTGNTILNSGINAPFYGSGSPAENLMQACLGVQNTNAGTVTIQGLQAGTYDLYLYSSAGNALQTPVTRFAANGSYDEAGPNSGNNVLTVEGNYVHLTPIVSASGVLTVSLAGLGVTADASLNGLQLSGPGATILAPVASFTATPANVFVTQSVAFTDTSSGNITNWVWNFGDGNSVTNSSGSTTHAYAAAGAYTVSLTANGPSGSSTINVVGSVTVYARLTLGSPVLSADSLTISGTGGIPDAQYRILTATDVSLPLASWTTVATSTFAEDGSYSYTQSSLTNAASFFRLVTP